MAFTVLSSVRMGFHQFKYCITLFRSKIQVNPPITISSWVILPGNSLKSMWNLHFSDHLFLPSVIRPAQRRITHTHNVYRQTTWMGLFLEHSTTQHLFYRHRQSHTPVFMKLFSLWLPFVHGGQMLCKSAQSSSVPSFAKTKMQYCCDAAASDINYLQQENHQLYKYLKLNSSKEHTSWKLNLISISDNVFFLRCSLWLQVALADFIYEFPTFHSVWLDYVL